MPFNFKKLEADLASKIEKRRWQAASDLGEHIKDSPQPVWEIIERHGSSSNEDLRTAIATCLLEHLLQHHFKVYFPKVKQKVLAKDALFADTFSRCWKFGQSEEAGNSKAWEALAKQAGKLRVKE
jgi:hypothetical protein